MSISVKIDRANKTVVWTSDRTATVVTARISEMSEGLKERAMFDGVRIRGERAGAMGFDHWDGKEKAKRYATDNEKMLRIQRVVEHMNDPRTGWDWDLRPSTDPLAGKSEDQLKALIAAAQARLATIGIKAQGEEGEVAEGSESAEG